MNRAKISLVLASLMLAAMWAAPSHAAEETMKKDQLYTMLANMGYTVEKAQGNNDYDIYVKTNFTYNLDYRVALSADGSRVWLTQSLATLTPELKAKMPWQKLLAANCTQITSCFRYSEENNTLSMSLSFESRGLTPALLRKQIDVFLQDIVSSSDLWDTAKWNKQASVAKP